MSEESPHEQAGPGARETAREDVGPLGEEAAKLLGALSDWARERADEGAPASAGPRLADQAADVVRGIDEHLATGSAECRWCPVCRVVHAVRQTSPEVRDHLVSAAGSLLEAAAGLLATQVPGDGGREARGDGQRDGRKDGQRHGQGLEHIDLDEAAGDEDWDLPEDRT